ncbi:MAG: ABC transporter ATP-binding protein/permease [Dehalococcoidia bacterium]|nr:ABC transporter ATP-binding protein/permease [Dehalococcoidia bacterium]
MITPFPQKTLACDSCQSRYNYIITLFGNGKGVKVKPLHFVLRYARAYSRVLVITIASMVLLVGGGLIIPWIIENLLTTLQSGDVSDQMLRDVSRLSLIAMGIFLLRAVFSFTQNYCAHIAGWGVVADVRKFIYERMQRFKLRFYEDKQTGQLMTRVMDDTGKFEDMIAHAVPNLLVSAVTLLGVITVLMIFNWQLALLSLIPIPFVILFMRGFAKYVRPAFRLRQAELANINAVLADNITGIRDIKAFTREEEEALRFNRGIERHRRLSLKAIKMMSAFEPLVDLASSAGTLIVIYFGGRLVVNESLTVPVLVAFFLYLSQLYAPVRTMSISWEHVQEALASADRLTELVDEEPEVNDAPGALQLTERARGELVFRNVTFGYKNGITVLEHIDLEIPAKSVVALVGPSGVGKSTLVSLIPRFYDVSNGAVMLDGKDIKTITLESLRRQVSIVLQDVFLFHGTVRDNILFGRPDATDEEVIAAAKAANAHEFVTAMPDGYDTLVGERGVKLSGGQKQRISIARALLKDAPVLILDEATSSIDTETEVLIQQALERLMAGRTTIIIAHRLSTIRGADQIVVLDGKHIAERGTHAALMTRHGLYARLTGAQNRLDRGESSSTS